MKNFRANGLAVMLTLMLATAGAHAAMTTSSDASAFDAAVTSEGIETFFGVSQDAVGRSPMHRRTFGTEYTYVAETSPSGLVGAGSADQVWLTSNVATDVITFTGFSSPITAFGGYFFGTDFNGQYQLGDVVLTATDASGGTLQQTISGATTSSFLGFLSDGDAIVSVSLYAPSLPSGDSVWATSGGLVLAESLPAVPEPPAIALLLGGLASLGWARRRGWRQIWLH